MLGVEGVKGMGSCEIVVGDGFEVLGIMLGWGAVVVGVGATGVGAT